MKTTAINQDINVSVESNEPEIELLLACVRSKLDEREQVKIKNLVIQEIDWNFVLSIATKHKILPLLCYHLNDLGSDFIPATTITFFKNFFKSNSQKNLLLTSELLKILTILKQYQIPYIVLKGPVLAIFSYANFGLRTISDLDILVEKKNFILVQNLLLKLEYKPGKLNNPDYYQQAQFFPKNNTFGIDLHYDFAPKNFFVSVDVESFWERLESISIANNDINILVKEDLILYLCLEGGKEHWKQVNRLCDIAESIKNHNFSWDILVQRATYLGKEKVLFLSLFLIKEILDVSIPNNIWQLVEKNLSYKLSREQINQYLFSHRFDMLRALQWHLFNLQAFPSIIEKLRYCRQVIKVNYQVRSAYIFKDN